jgi:hypothetical protein
MTNENRVKTSELDARFNIRKNARVNRLAMLGFTPDRLTKEGRFYYLTPAQVELFADFDKHIRETGGTAGYPHLLVNNVDTLPPPAEPEIVANAVAAEELPAGQLTTQAPDDLDIMPARTDIVASGTDEFTGEIHWRRISMPKPSAKRRQS